MKMGVSVFVLGVQRTGILQKIINMLFY